MPNEMAAAVPAVELTDAWMSPAAHSVAEVTPLIVDGPVTAPHDTALASLVAITETLGIAPTAYTETS